MNKILSIPTHLTGNLSVRGSYDRNRNGQKSARTGLQKIKNKWVSMQYLFYKVTIRRMQRKICKRLTTSQVADSQIRKTYSWRQRELFPRAPILNMEHRIYKLPSSSS